ncbi:hypothetical protein FH972_022619 [Carpinus fangiana]|uniref:DUF3074 domain-containing protein n=1 Tax=Carpinus fangiana TaxID=176857 RepID=A0A5N6KTA5_9ROSI|nr:hypothetical protein FH972_022619 [Carpinus fangiana]
MASLKPALCSMSEIDSADLPEDSSLGSFLTEAFAHSEKLLNSLPSPDSQGAPPTSSELPLPGAASNAADTLFDSSSIPASAAPRGTTAEDQKLWGKPLKLNAKDNPLKVKVYKMASHDRRGAWFARRSVHTGIGFERMKRCMQKEFLESLKTEGGPGSGAVRGIAGDRRLIKKSVADVGKVEVWQLSSSFPGPVAPREFVAMLISGENCLTKESAPEGSDNIPRGFVTISRPSKHPEAQPRLGLVMGTYESVEMVREIPLYPDNPEANPVEWTMITRSEPGGGIPKFLVERGTPGSIVADVAKWLQWALDQGDVAPVDEEQEEAEVAELERRASQVEPSKDLEANQDNLTHKASHVSAASSTGTGGGPLGYLAMASNYVQEKASGYLPYFANGRVSSSSSSDISSSDEEDEADSASFRSADDTAPPHVSYQAGQRTSDSQESIDANSRDLDAKHGAIASPSESTTALIADIESRPGGPVNSHERELLKLSQKRRDLDERIAKSRAADEARAQSISSKEATLQQKAAERHERDVRKQEQRYREQLERIEKNRAKEARKIEERRKKADEKDETRKARTQRDEWKEKYKVLESENDILRSQVESLQKENTSMAAGLGGFGTQGDEVIRKARAAGLGDKASNKSKVSLDASGDEHSKSRATSTKSSIRPDGESTKSGS